MYIYTLLISRKKMLKDRKIVTDRKVKGITIADKLVDLIYKENKIQFLFLFCLV